MKGAWEWSLHALTREVMRMTLDRKGKLISRHDLNVGKLGECVWEVYSCITEVRLVLS